MKCFETHRWTKMLWFMTLAVTFYFPLSPFLCPLAFAEDLELSDLNVPKLVLPAETPGGLRLPDVIVKKDEWRGVQCAVTEPRVAVFRHQEPWAAFWLKAVAPYSPKLEKVPEVNFETEMVIGVFLGDKNTPNFEVEIVRLVEVSPEVREVRYKEIRKMQGVFTPPFVIQPFHLKKVPAFSGQVLFQPDHK